MPTQKMPGSVLFNYWAHLSFKLDTGVKVTAISESIFRTLPQVELRPPNRALYGLSRKHLSVSLLMVFVVKGLRNSLLRLPTIQALHLVSRTD